VNVAVDGQVHVAVALHDHVYDHVYDHVTITSTLTWPCALTWT